jgi:hypothetical protein
MLTSPSGNNGLERLKSRDARAAGEKEKCNFHPIGGSVEPAYGPPRGVGAGQRHNTRIAIESNDGDGWKECEVQGLREEVQAVEGWCSVGDQEEGARRHGRRSGGEGEQGDA